MKPRVNFAVENKLQEGGGKIAVDVTFESLDDFSPDAVARNIAPLWELNSISGASSPICAAASKATTSWKKFFRVPLTTPQR